MFLELQVQLLQRVLLLLEVVLLFEIDYGLYINWSYVVPALDLFLHLRELLFELLYILLLLLAVRLHHLQVGYRGFLAPAGLRRQDAVPPLVRVNVEERRRGRIARILDYHLLVLRLGVQKARRRLRLFARRRVALLRLEDVLQAIEEIQRSQGLRGVMRVPLRWSEHEARDAVRARVVQRQQLRRLQLEEFIVCEVVHLILIIIILLL